MIPGNDDAIRSCSLVIKAIADGIEVGRTKVAAAEMAAPKNGSPEPEAVVEPEPEAAPEPEVEAEPQADAE